MELLGIVILLIGVRILGKGVGFCPSVCSTETYPLYIIMGALVTVAGLLLFLLTLQRTTRA